jgi:hypothetical protein
MTKKEITIALLGQTFCILGVLSGVVYFIILLAQ